VTVIHCVYVQIARPRANIPVMTTPFEHQMTVLGRIPIRPRFGIVMYRGIVSIAQL